MNQELINFEANFSVLDRYGTYVTKEEYITDPAIGRDEEIKQLILVLLTPEKSAILIGKPGIGKTAIVEGLAYRIQKNDVPPALLGYEIINIKTASLLGTMPSGESKVQKMIDELKTKEKLILFIDEIHMLIGATDSSSLDFANIFKEGLGRGSIKVIGATTTEEYERYILRDKAFTRRFQKIEVPEPNREDTIKIMMGTLPKFEKQTGRKMKYTPFIQGRIMGFLVDITSEYKRVYALGSRYPDVCLTLLKQAFSYTVYDNRPYMDIFDVRKAIENSKNIYPDVIKKELPNFDKMFNDIILEEKGEKPVEEWRRDNTLTRSELEENNLESLERSTQSIFGNNSNVKKSSRSKGNITSNLDKTFEKLESTPEMVDRLELRDNKPLESILNSKGKRKFAKIGSTDGAKGLRATLNRKQDTRALDDILLQDKIDVLKPIQNKGPVIPTSFVVTEEIRPGVNDSYLLGRPILSINDETNTKNEEQIGVYKSDNINNKKTNGDRQMWDDVNRRPERMDINSQNFDKYHNFFHQEDNGYQNENAENRKRMDMLMGVNNSNNGGNMTSNFNQMNGPMSVPMGGPMNGPMGGPMNGPMNGPMGGPMGGPMNGPMDGPMGGPMSGPMGGPMGGPMNGPMNGPMSVPMNGPMGGPTNGPMGGPMGGSINNPSSMPMNNRINEPNMNKPKSFLNTDVEVDEKEEEKETLFGAPMYGTKEKESKYDNIPDPFSSEPEIQEEQNNRFMPNNGPRDIMNSGPMRGPMRGPMNGPMGGPMGGPMNGPMNGPMGGPMSGPMNGPMGGPMSGPMNGPIGSPMGGPMNIPNGNPVNDFFPNGSPAQQNQSGSTSESLFGAPMYSGEQKTEQQSKEVDIFGQLISNNMRIKNGKIVDEFPTFDKINNLSNIKSVISDVRDVSENKSSESNNSMFINGNSSKKWQYIDNNEPLNALNSQLSTPVDDNILDSIPKIKEENNILSSASPIAPTSNKDYYEDMKQGEFVNLTDLNSGKIKEEDTNKYIGVQTRENKPQFDLNLETNKNEEESFDDFFE